MMHLLVAQEFRLVVYGCKAHARNIGGLGAKVAGAMTLSASKPFFLPPSISGPL